MNNRKRAEFGGLMRRLYSFTPISVLIITCIMGMSGCGDRTPEVEQIEKPITLYYVSDEFIETGNESKGVLVAYDRVSIYLPKETPKGMTEQEAASRGYTAAVSFLWDEPEDLDDVDSVVTKKVGIHNITCDAGTAYVDIIGEDLKGVGGSMEETLFISQIVETLVNSFDEIERVQFLVDGQQVETLMGHVDTTEPYTAGLYTTVKAQDFERQV